MSPGRLVQPNIEYKAPERILEMTIYRTSMALCTTVVYLYIRGIVRTSDVPVFF
jgi:hypothetical protein